MVNATPIYPLSALRALALHTQALAAPPQSAPTPDAIYNMVERLGCVQIDTLQVVHRSQYLVLWSRLGRYTPADFDRLIYGDSDAPPGQNTRRLFEYWQHAASIIPLTEYRYRLPTMRWFRENHNSWNREWSMQPENQELIRAVVERVRQEGRVRAADFEHPDHRPGSWWNWKPAKRALEQLYNRGELMIANRVNFQRVYDLAERVLPEWVDQTEPTGAEAKRYRVEQAVRALGVCQPAQAAEYAYMKRGEAKPVVEALTAEGVFVTVQGALNDGSVSDLIVHRDHLPLLQRAADGALTAQHTTFLSPFDSLFWARDRDMQFWAFRQVLECYKPEPQRVWGYFCLPILHRDRIVGRFDPKLERDAGVLRLKALYLEPGIDPDGALVADVAGAMRDFMAFHNASDLVIERSDPAAFGAKLLAVL